MPGIAIIGMACRYPDARSPAELWENVLAQRRSFRRMPPERMRLEDYWSPDRRAEDATYSVEAALIEGYEFDRVRFRVSGAQYRSADVAHWLALDVASQALADAGFVDGDGLPRESTGVLLANTLTGDTSRANVMRLRWPYVRRVVSAQLTSHGWSAERVEAFLAELEATYKEPFPPVDEETLAGGLSNTIAGRICNHFDLKGGGYTLDGACAASLLAVSQACSSLAAGDLDVAVVGGVDLSLDPFELVGFAKAGALAADDMRVYDQRSQGFWPGEGCGFVVLMREDAARSHDKRIHAVIRGWGVSSDGTGGITRPEADGQLLALKRAYQRAGFNIAAIDYIEGHGTGTAVGDATELSVLTAARRDAAAERPAAIGSVKANIGHTKAAAGMAGLLKTTMALREGVIPPITGCVDPHALLCGASAQLRAPQAPEERQADTPFRAGVSAMGFGGLNTHVVLEEPGEAQPRAGVGRPMRSHACAQDAEVFVFAADGAAELRASVGRVRAYAERLSRAELTDLAAELAKKDTSREYRAAVVADTPAELAKRLAQLEGWLADGVTARLDLPGGVLIGHGRRIPRIAFLLPGQASPSHRTGGVWRNRFSAVRELYDAAHLSMDGDDVRTEVAQPAIVTAELAALRVLHHLGVEANVAIGHSLGELTALHWAGAMDEAALLRVVTTRGRAMADLPGPHGTMAAVAASSEQVEKMIAGTNAVIASFNTPILTVISGDERSVREAMSRARQQGVRATQLAVSHAFHSPLVSGAATPLAQQIRSESLRPLSRDVISTITGGSLPADVDISELLITQLTSPVRFSQAVSAASKTTDFFIEAGPGAVLGTLISDFVEKPVVSLDACGSSFGGLLRAIATAFALGAPVHVERLFEDRLVRPFALDWRPTFIANPCEAAPMSAMPLQPRARSTAEPIESHVEKSPADESPFDVVRDLVARRAELPPDVIAAESRLLGDLHLNSIVIGQLAVEASKRLGLPPPVAPLNYAHATVGSVADALSELARSGNGKGHTRERFPAGVDAWVRPFAVEWREAPSPAAQNTAPIPSQSGEGWQVIAHQFCPFKPRICEGLARAGMDGGVMVCVPPLFVEESPALLLQGARAVLAERKVDRFVVVEDTREDEPPGGFNAAAFARTLHLEAPHVDVSVVHVPTDHPRAVEWVLAETHQTGFHETRIDSTGRRFEPVLRPIELQPARDAPLSPDDVLLVTGGGKGIGAECALALASEYGVRLAILGRSDPTTDAELARNLERFTAAGATFRYFATDVVDEPAVSATIVEVERLLGPVTAFIHAAGVNTPRLLNDLDNAAFERTVLPKLQGARNVLTALDASRLKLFVAFGSLIARAGMAGEADYAVANDWLASLAERWQAEHPHCRSLAIEWSVWSGMGMGERLGRIESLMHQGVTPIPPDEGVRIFKHLLASESPVRVVVSGRFGDSPTLRVDGAPLPFLRFLESPQVHVPGVELVVDSTISSDSDPYLDDHVFHGERLVPAVMGLEAMAQAAMALVGAHHPPSFESVELSRPIVIPREGEATLRVAALVRKKGVVDVAVRCDQTAFAVDHFRATCRFDPKSDDGRNGGELKIGNLPAALPLTPEADLYGSLLFHSGRFRKVMSYRRLRARQCLAELCAPDAGAWFGAYLPGQLILGDPAARDATIHAIQPCIPHATVLPVGADRIERYSNGSAEARYVEAVERSQTGSEFIYDVRVFAGDGTPLESWRGLRLRAIGAAQPADSRHPALLGPYLERRIGELLPLSAMSVIIQPSGGRERQSASDAAMREALGDAGRISRRADGKPIASGSQSVSASHFADHVMAVAGDAPLGCDAEAVTLRDPETWRGLLGTDRFALALLLASETGEPIDVAATRVWCATECLKKAGASHNAPLVLNAAHDTAWITLRSGSLTIFTAALRVRDLATPVVFAILTATPQPGDGHAGL